MGGVCPCCAALLRRTLQRCCDVVQQSRLGGLGWGFQQRCIWLVPLGSSPVVLHAEDSGRWMSAAPLLHSSQSEAFVYGSPVHTHGASKCTVHSYAILQHGCKSPLRGRSFQRVFMYRVAWC